jgi:hypothetical protein
MRIEEENILLAFPLLYLPPSSVSERRRWTEETGGQQARTSTFTSLASFHPSLVVSSTTTSSGQATLALLLFSPNNNNENYSHYIQPVNLTSHSVRGEGGRRRVRRNEWRPSIVVEAKREIATGAPDQMVERMLLPCCSTSFK